MVRSKCMTVCAAPARRRRHRWIVPSRGAAIIAPPSVTEAGRRDVPTNDDLNVAARAWIARMTEGDEAALALFYDATLGHVFGLAVRVTQDQDAAEDVVAETYLQAWQQAGRYSVERGTPLAWLLNMCRSRALDHLRRRGATVPAGTPPASDAEGDADADPLSLVMALQAAERLRDAIATLPEIAQRLIGLAFFRGLSHQDIAQTTGLPLGTVKSHLRRAQEVLRTLYQEAR